MVYTVRCALVNPFGCQPVISTCDFGWLQANVRMPCGKYAKNNVFAVLVSKVTTPKKSLSTNCKTTIIPLVMEHLN